jgi:hypothetical protein
VEHVVFRRDAVLAALEWVLGTAELQWFSRMTSCLDVATVITQLSRG